MAFERFVPPQKTKTTQPKATIRPSGLISFDATAVETFGLDKAAFAVLFFDKTRKLIGVEPVAKQGEAGAFKLSRRRRSVSLKAPEFFDGYGLALEESRRCDVAKDRASGKLAIDVKSIPRRRGRRPKRS